MASNTTTKMIKLKSSDGLLIEVPETVARQSRWIASQIEDMNSKPEEVPRPILSVPVATMVLWLVMAYCEKHAAAEAAHATKTENEKAQEGSSNTMPTSDEELDNWDKRFINVGVVTLYDLLLAARYMKIDSLEALASKRVDDRRRWLFRQFSTFKIVVSTDDQEEQEEEQEE